jgi:hypothetical protein
MSYYPTSQELETLGFEQGFDEDGNEIIYLMKEPGCVLTLENDEGWAVVTEWLSDGIHGWVTCGSFEDMKYAVEKAFEVLAEGRSKISQTPF